MKFFGVHIEDLESERFLAASNDQIATWLFLHALCSKQCNGGTIPDAASLPDRFWNRHGIDRGILAITSPLWSWIDDALTVEPYDIAGQTVFEKKVAGGKSRAKQRWGSTPKTAPDSTPSRTPNAPNPTRDNPTQPEKKEPDFQSIVGAYPRRENIREALRHVSDSVANGADPAAILTGTRAIAAVIQQLPSGHHNAYVASAATFFKNERWRDDPQTWLRQGAAKNGAAASTLNLGGRGMGTMTRISPDGEAVTELLKKGNGA